MNDQRVKTDNEVIAEFMGFSSVSTEHDTFWSLPEYPPATVHKWQHHSNGLIFNLSWDWLMPAIQIAKERIKEAGWGTSTEKEAWSRLKMCLNEVSNINIQNAHYCLVKFIEWYQKQKSS